MPWYPISYAALYRDAYGEEHTTLTNHGRDLTMVVRDIAFTDTGLDGFCIIKTMDFASFLEGRGPSRPASRRASMSFALKKQYF